MQYNAKDYKGDADIYFRERPNQTRLETAFVEK